MCICVCVCGGGGGGGGGDYLTANCTTNELWLDY